MIKTLIDRPDINFKWLDITQPTREELNGIAKEYGLHPTSVKDSLEPEHLPKHEVIGHTTFIIIRIYDKDSDEKADTIHELTRKIAVFYSDDFIITIHRSEQNFLEEIAKSREGFTEDKSAIEFKVFGDIIRYVLKSYEKELEKDYNIIDLCETDIFSQKKNKDMISELYHLKRRAYVYKRILNLTKDISAQVTIANDYDKPFVQDVQEYSVRLIVMAEDQIEYVNNLLNLHIQFQSQRTNEIVRVLTLFSAFFLPLTFIVGIYGMNFNYMPELNEHWGYPAVIAVMGGVSLSIYIWFKKNKWM